MTLEDLEVIRFDAYWVEYDKCPDIDPPLILQRKTKMDEPSDATNASGTVAPPNPLDVCVWNTDNPMGWVSGHGHFLPKRYVYYCPTCGRPIQFKSEATR